ncbi:hypothetical protein O1L55_17885 [Streptomyces albulus]|nr:hypothetical protein [Streptomyces noursei]
MSLHLRATPQTQEIIDARRLALLGPRPCWSTPPAPRCSTWPSCADA